MTITTHCNTDNNHLPPPLPVPNLCGTAVSNIENRCRVLIVGSTGFIGRFVAEASIAAGYTTYLLARPGSANPSKANALRDLQESGATVIHGREKTMRKPCLLMNAAMEAVKSAPAKGDPFSRELRGCIKDQNWMEKILSEFEIDVVISAVGGEAILDQLNLIKAIETVRTVKRFIPSEFGHDIDRAEPVEPGLTMYCKKRKVRRAIEAAEIPYTYICCNSIAGWPYHDNTHPSEMLPPLDQFKIYGDGNVKAYFVAGEDIGKFTMKAVTDVRALNKKLHFQPPCNCLSVNEMASLWEKKINRKLPRFVITEENLLAAAAEMCIPRSIVAALTHDIFINGCQINFSINEPNDEDVGHLYPDIPYRTLDKCFDDYVVKIIDKNNIDDGSIATTVALPTILPVRGVILGHNLLVESS